MPKVAVADMTRADYERAAQEYLAKLPPEHFMEAEPQATQRSITTASFRWLEAQRPGFHYFNELLVQYPVNGDLGQVVPDNMVVLGGSGHECRGSYNVVFEQTPLFWTLEYVSPSSERKDYGDSFTKYEQQLRVPYYLVFYPEKQDLRLYHHTGEAYIQIEPDAAGRLAIPELEMHVGIYQGWVRYWYQGRLIPMPEELQREVDLQTQLIQALRDSANDARRQAEKLVREKEAAESQALHERQEKEAAEQHLLRERQEKEAAEQRLLRERQEKEAAEQRLLHERQEKEALAHRAEQLTAQLRALGIDPAA